MKQATCHLLYVPVAVSYTLVYSHMTSTGHTDYVQLQLQIQYPAIITSCCIAAVIQYVPKHVIKATDESGGYAVIILNSINLAT